jgi:hypothetical protein
MVGHLKLGADDIKKKKKKFNSDIEKLAPVKLI